MRSLLKKTFAAATAAVFSSAVFANMTALCADEEPEEKKEVTIIFDWEEEGVTPSKTTDTELFKEQTTSYSYITIPSGYFSKTGYDFKGWTIDGVRGYTAGTTLSLPEDADTVVFKPCWTDAKGEKHTVTYVLEYGGEEIERPEWLEDEKYKPNDVFTPNYNIIQNEKYISKGISDGERVYRTDDQLVMPDHDLVLYPVFYKKINITYSAGDVDRMNGMTEATYEKIEASNIELSDKTRFSRNGFELVGWTSDYDGKTYEPEQTVTIPDKDVTFTAVWKAKTYKVVFINGADEKFVVAGETDTEIECPTPTVIPAGKVFAGWKDSGGELHAAGSKYTILGAMPGMGISLSAVFETEGAQTTTAAPAVTTSTTMKAAETTTTATASTTSKGTATTSAASKRTTTSTATTGAATTTTAAATNVQPSLLGDANGDNKVTVADAVAILQYIGNRDKYGLTPTGLANADVDGQPGITGMDALAIQQLDAQLIKKLPAEK